MELLLGDMQRQGVNSLHALVKALEEAATNKDNTQDDREEEARHHDTLPATVANRVEVAASAVQLHLASAECAVAAARLAADQGDLRMERAARFLGQVYATAIHVPFIARAGVLSTQLLERLGGPSAFIEATICDLLTGAVSIKSYLVIMAGILFSTKYGL